MYGVFDNGKPASKVGFPELKGKGWENHLFQSLSQAQNYAREWMGEYAPVDAIYSLPVGRIYDYSGYGDMIEIRIVEG